MNFIFSLLYAPFVFILLRYFDVKIISIIIFFISLVWLVLLKNKRDIEIFFPLFYIAISFFAFFSDAFLVLKTIPLFISIFYALFILMSYFQKKSYIMHFAEKISKEPLGEKEKEYIQQSTLFWFAISIINVCVHLFFYLEVNLEFWIYYSSFGWYLLFGLAGAIQFVHRRYVFLRREDV